MIKPVEIIDLAKSSLITLKSLKSTCLGNVHDAYNPFDYEYDSSKHREELGDYKDPLEKVLMGINEADLILRLMEYFDTVESNTMKLDSMIVRLNEENSWLRDEISSYQCRLNEVEEENVELQEKLKDYEFKLMLKKYDNDKLSTSYSSQQLSASNANLTESTISTQLGEELSYSATNSKKLPPNCYNIQPKNTNPLSGNNNGATTGANTTGTSSGSSNNYELPDHLKTLHSLITAYSQQNRFEVAVALCKQAIDNELSSLASKKKILDNNSSLDSSPTLGTEEVNKANGNLQETTDATGELISLDIATLQNILALVYRDQGNYVKAVDLLTNSLSIREKLLGVDHPLIAITLNNIAILQAKNGKLREAENLCRRALNIREHYLGNNHPDVAKQLFNLALLVQNQGRYEEVEQIYKKALSIYVDNFGQDNINVMKTRNNIAYVHLKQSNFVQAEIIFKELLTCWHERLTSHSVTNNATAATTDTASSLANPRKPLWVYVEDKNQVTASGPGVSTFSGIAGSAQLRSSDELHKAMPLYQNAAHLPREEFDLFSSTISYLIRAYKGQNKLVEADILEDWLSRSIKYYDDNCITTASSNRGLVRRSSSSWSTSIPSQVSTDQDDPYSFIPFSPNMKVGFYPWCLMALLLIGSFMLMPYDCILFAFYVHLTCLVILLHSNMLVFYMHLQLCPAYLVFIYMIAFYLQFTCIVHLFVLFMPC